MGLGGWGYLGGRTRLLLLPCVRTFERPNPDPLKPKWMYCNLEPGSVLDIRANF